MRARFYFLMFFFLHYSLHALDSDVDNFAEEISVALAAEGSSEFITSIEEMRTNDSDYSNTFSESEAKKVLKIWLRSRHCCLRDTPLIYNCSPLLLPDSGVATLALAYFIVCGLNSCTLEPCTAAVLGASDVYWSARSICCCITALEYNERLLWLEDERLNLKQEIVRRVKNRRHQGSNAIDRKEI